MPKLGNHRPNYGVSSYRHLRFDGPTTVKKDVRDAAIAVGKLLISLLIIIVLLFEKKSIS